MRAPKLAPTATAKPPLVREVIDFLDINRLVPNPRNPRKHSDDQINRLMASLRTNGQTRHVLARKANLMLIAGHGVREAAMRLGMTQLSVVLLDVDQKEADRIMLADNRLGDLSTSDPDNVAEILRTIDATDWLATGYTPEEGEKLFKGISGADLVVTEIESDDRADAFWISVRGPLGEQAQALQRIKALMADMPKVEVTLGTTDDFS
jgi:hypothetical protein